jgi:hypothetical protein
VIKHDQIIIGRTPSCLLFSWRTQTPCILTHDLTYHRCDPQFEDLDLSEFNTNDPVEMMTNLSFIMGFTGLLLHPSNVQTLRIDENINLITKNNRKVIYNADPVRFDGKQDKLLDVYDEFHWRRGTAHAVDELMSRDRMCRKINFYSSRRRGVRPDTKDLTVASIMDENQLLSPDYGNGVVRVKALRMMHKAGLKGQLGMVKNGKEYYKQIKMDFHERKVVPRFKQLKTFKEVFEMKQAKEKPWKTFETLRFKQRTS